MKYLILTFFTFLYFHVQAQPAFQTRVVADNLFIPWEIIYAEDDHIWFTQKNGFICKLDPQSGQIDTLIHEDINAIQGEGGMLGLALEFNLISQVNIYVAYQYHQGPDYFLQVKKYNYDLLSQVVISEDTLLTDITGANNHNGCRLLLEGGKLFITTGDAEIGSNAQDLTSLNGKILRMNTDGSIPQDNPIQGSPIWSWGHRNAQGLTFHNNKLYSSEHGPDSDDEINIIEKGRNYGWSEVLGFCNTPEEQQFCADSNVVEPLIEWTPTIAPAGVEYYNHPLFPDWQHSLLLTSLKDENLYHLKLNTDGDSILHSEIIQNLEFGRLRDITISPEGKIYISTSNSPASGNETFIDQIIEIYTEDGNSISNSEERSAVSIYPNPVKEQLHLKYTEKSLKSLSPSYFITDIYGKILEKGFINHSYLDVSHLIPGIYFLKIKIREDTSNIKFIKS